MLSFKRLFKKRPLPHGRFQVVSASQLNGWVRYPRDSSGPVTLEIRLNDTVQGKVVAEMPRADLKKLGIHPSGECGFTFQLAQPVSAKDIVTIIDAKTRRELIRSSIESLAASPRATFDSESRLLGMENEQTKLYFMHLPKTAGTSVRDMLSSEFHQYEIYPNRQVMKRYRGGYPHMDEYWSLTPEETQAIRLFMGHYPYGLRKAFGENIDVLVFLRNPVSRTISHLNHLKNRTVKFRDLSIEEIYNHHTRLVTNVQSRLVASDYVAPPPAGRELTEATRANPLQAAKQNLSACRFVGITERISESISLLNRLYGFNIKQIPNLNPARHHHNISEELLARIQKDNARDNSFYEYGVKLFEQRLKECM